MKSLKLHLENCHGIRKLKHTFNFEECSSVVIYAPNGSMKSSLANTFDDVANDRETRDRIFVDRKPRREIVDETGKPIDPKSIMVIGPVNKEEFVVGERASTLLVNSKLRKEYEELLARSNKIKEDFISMLNTQYNLNVDIEKEVSLTFTKDADNFKEAVMRISDEVENQRDPEFQDVPYDIVFNEKVEKEIVKPEVQEALEDYIKHFNTLIEKSEFFKRGKFTYYNANIIANALEKNSFFEAKHVIKLVGQDKSREITSKSDLVNLINEEKDEITSDKDLRTKFKKIEKILDRNTELRDFANYISRDEFVLPHIVNINSFKEKVWKSYFVKNRDMYDEMISEFRRVGKRKREIEDMAESERSDWEDVIDIFNTRFFVPFELIVKNYIGVSLGQEPIPMLGYRFKEFEDGKTVAVDFSSKDELTDKLSTGELRAFYILNVIFEVNVRQKNGEKTIIIVDDIADSFDYRNKYAIIQYLEEISKYDNFTQIILTHNYDFFRSIIGTGNIASEKALQLMVEKWDDKITLSHQKWGRNVFVDKWKKNYSTSTRQRIASIPFLRNLIEYTKGSNDQVYQTLTSLLHIRNDTEKYMDELLFDVYEKMFDKHIEGAKQVSILQLIIDEANECLNDSPHNPRLENKIVLSIATRLVAEKYMIHRINDKELVDSIESNQTRQLYDIFVEKFDDKDIISILNRVVLMTPENIHLNSFMYEPIVDMSDEHLRLIFKDVKELLKSVSTDLDWNIDMKF